MIARLLTVAYLAWLTGVAREHQEEIRCLRLRVARLELQPDLRNRVAQLEADNVAVHVAARAYLKALRGWRGA